MYFKFKTEKDFKFTVSNVIKVILQLTFVLTSHCFADDKMKFSQSRENLKLGLQMIFAVY